jgi:CsoR family transcriptional regulator, copper-sensing transcriptional repressor
MTMYKPQDTKERITHRLQISLGHLKKVIQMVEDDEYCIDILHQSQAIQNALKETDHVILENHLKTCAADAIKNGDAQTAISEIMEVIKKKK